MADLPTFVAAGTKVDDVNPNTVVPGLPAGLQEGDILYLLIEAGSSGTGDLSQPAGWGTLVATAYGNTAGTVPDTKISVYRRTATGSEVAPTVPTQYNHVAAQLFAFRGAEAVPNAVATTGDASTNFTDSADGPTTDEDNCLLVLFHGFGDEGACGGASPHWSNASVADITLLSAHSHAQGNDGGWTVISATMVSQGDTGTFTASHSTSEQEANVVVALEPASTGVAFAGVLGAYYYDE
jgi:hypothetical protein